MIPSSGPHVGYLLAGVRFNIVLEVSAVVFGTNDADPVQRSVIHPKLVRLHLMKHKNRSQNQQQLWSNQLVTSELHHEDFKVIGFQTLPSGTKTAAYS